MSASAFAAAGAAVVAGAAARESSAKASEGDVNEAIGGAGAGTVATGDAVGGGELGLSQTWSSRPESSDVSCKTSAKYGRLPVSFTLFCSSLPSVPTRFVTISSSCQMASRSIGSLSAGRLSIRPGPKARTSARSRP